MQAWVWVALGGALGALGRHLLASWIGGSPSSGRWPWGTLVVNLAGCLVAGMIWGWLERRAAAPAPVRLFLLTGVLGGFTTLSAFSLDTLQLISRGAVRPALFYVGLTVVGGLVAAAGGYALVQPRAAPPTVTPTAPNP